jgi:hypothetical protein
MSSVYISALNDSPLVGNVLQNQNSIVIYGLKPNILTLILRPDTMVERQIYSGVCRGLRLVFLACILPLSQTLSALILASAKSDSNTLPVVGI